jgi:hypothetical protein
MGTEFVLKRVSPSLVQVFEEFGELGFDIFEESDLLDEDEGEWTEDKVEKFFYSGGKLEFQDFPKERTLLILSEGQTISQSSNLSVSFNGKLVGCIHALWAGKCNLYRQDFIVKEVPHPHKNTDLLVLVNALVGRVQLKNELGLYASYLTSAEVKETTDFLPRVINDDYKARWQALYRSDKNTSPPYPEELRVNEETIYLIIRDELLPFLVETTHLGYGILSRRSY